MQNKKAENENKIVSTKQGVFNQILVTCAILFCAAACGMPIGFSAILLPQLYNNTSSEFSIDIEMGSWIASIHSLATPFGSFVSGSFADQFGRKPVLMCSCVPLIIGWIFIALSQSPSIILIGRVLSGFAVGLTGPPAQIILTEMAEPRFRGLLAGFPFVCYSLGILLVYSLGSIFHWRVVALYSIFLPVLAGMALYLIPESPVWLIRNGKLELAAKTLKWVRGNELIAKQEFEQLLKHYQNEHSTDNQTSTFLITLRSRATIKPFLIIITFNFLIIFSGTYLIVFYAIDIFSKFDSDINSMRAAVVTAIIRMIFTLILSFLLLTINRRTIIILSGLGSAFSCLALSIYMYLKLEEPKTFTDTYFVAVCITTYIAFNTSFMVMPGIMIGELLPAKIRGRLAGYIFALFHVSTFGLTKIFPWITVSVKLHGLFFIFGLSSLAAATTMFFVLPETKNSTLSDIEEFFKNNNFFWFKRVNIKNTI